MKWWNLCILIAAAVCVPARSQSYLDSRLGPLLRLARNFMSQISIPRDFELDYQAGMRNNVSD